MDYGRLYFLFQPDFVPISELAGKGNKSLLAYWPVGSHYRQSFDNCHWRPEEASFN